MKLSSQHVSIDIPGAGWATRKGGLIGRDELPAWYVSNPFILTKYRPPELSVCACAKTACEIHNETANIWTHFLGGLVWIYFCSNSLKSHDMAVRVDEFTYRLQLVCYGLCGIMPFTSALAHTFFCRSPSWYKACWSCDHAGIILLWLARALSEGYISWWCDRSFFATWCMIVLAVFSVLGYVVVIHSNEAIFLPLYMFIHIPVVSMTWKKELWVDDQSGVLLRLGLAMTLLGSMCGVIGYIIMRFRLPERWAPGSFDLWFHSHQWWHILTIVGPITCMEAGRVMISARLDGQCFV